MKPYIEVDNKRLYLPQSVDPHKYEVVLMEFGDDYFYLLCKKVSKRFVQATGVVMECVGDELHFHKVGDFYFQRTFPLDRTKTAKINIDWQATSKTGILQEQGELGD